MHEKCLIEMKSPSTRASSMIWLKVFTEKYKIQNLFSPSTSPARENYSVSLNIFSFVTELSMVPLHVSFDVREMICKISFCIGNKFLSACIRLFVFCTRNVKRALQIRGENPLLCRSAWSRGEIGGEHGNCSEFSRESLLLMLILLLLFIYLRFSLLKFIYYTFGFWKCFLYTHASREYEWSRTEKVSKTEICSEMLSGV